MDSPTVPLGALVARADAGDAAATAELFAALYSELHRLAEHHVHRGGSLTISATTLLHEAFLDLSKREGVAFVDRSRFLAYASRAMRGLLIDYIRTRRAKKRGGEFTIVSLTSPDGIDAAVPESVDDLAEALDALDAAEPHLAQLVDLKFFCGLSLVEIAALRGVSERTVQRDWSKARLFLHSALTPEDPA